MNIVDMIIILNELNEYDVASCDVVLRDETIREEFKFHMTKLIELARHDAKFQITKS
jgi:hypothetical protein